MRNLKSTMVGLGVAAALALGAQTANAQMYWRIDAGYSMAQDAGIKDKTFSATDGIICGDPGCNTGGELNDVGQSPVLQVGVGWRINPNFRTDVTFGYRPGFSIDDDDAVPSHFTGDITSMALMLNGYYDFSASWGKPYVGAGIGWASNKLDNVVNTFPGGSITAQGRTWTGFAWSLMAGIGFPMGGNMMLDVGYRYIDLGKIESGSGTATDSTFGPFPYSGLSGNLRAHELMVGLRF